MPKFARQNARRKPRPGKTLVWAAALAVAVTLLIVIALHLGYAQLVRTKLQVAADAAVIAGAAAMHADDRRVLTVARESAAVRFASGGPITADTQVEYGVWDQSKRTFHTTPAASNAVRVAVRGDATDYFFGPVFGRPTFQSQASAIAAAEPRDIALVVDLAAGADDRSKPAWTGHAARRAMLAAIKLIKERNRRVPDPNHRDWVSVITFGSFLSGAPAVVQPLTSDYDAAIETCANLNVAKGMTPGRNTDAGLYHARKHLAPPARKGAGRDRTDKVIVLITTGPPTAYITRPSEIHAHRSGEPSRDYYANGADWLDAPLVQADKMRAKGWRLYPVGIGPGADHDFLDRLARLGGTADHDGHVSRTGRTPVECEQRLVETLGQIVRSPQVSLVQ